MMQAPPAAPYPIRFDADYPERQSRWKAFFRLILAIPAYLFFALVSYAWVFLLLPTWVTIVVRGRMPRWLFDFHVGYLRFYYRVLGYFSLLTDVYPAFDREYPVHFDVTYPQRVSRWQVLIWKTATAIPQLIVVSVLWTAAMAITAVGWLVILFTGQFPKGLHEFVTGVLRWHSRVAGYWLSLTDQYPPYSMEASAPAATGAAKVISSGIGALAVAGLVAVIVLSIIYIPWSGHERVTQVSYDRLKNGQVFGQQTTLRAGSLQLDLVSVADPADEFVGFITPQAGHRVVIFSFLLTNLNTSSSSYHRVYASDFELKVAGETTEPLLAFIGRRSPPVRIGGGEFVGADIAFEVPTGSDPQELSYGGGLLKDKAIFQFR